MGYIYIIKNILNNKFYLGSTKNHHVRKLTHFNKLRKNKHHSLHLQRAWNKYGEENFIFIIIETCDNYLEREQFLFDNIIDFKDSYNVSGKATGGQTLLNHPNKEEIIAKAIINIKKFGRAVPRYKEDNPAWKGGKTFCKKCDIKINSNKSNLCIKCYDKSGENNPMYGKKLTDTSKQKLSEFRKGKYFGTQNKKVIIENVEYVSLSEAGRCLNEEPSKLLFRIKSKNPKFINYNYK